jgi:hypothetical protein
MSGICASVDGETERYFILARVWAGSVAAPFVIRGEPPRFTRTLEEKWIGANFASSPSGSLNSAPRLRELH